MTRNGIGGMIAQTAVMFVDAYRELHARKMFWIVLILSGVVVGAFALVAVGPKGVTVAGYELPIPLPPGAFYKYLFTSLLIGVWLTWAATILALISTAGIFPDFVAGGSIDLYLSKPISRLRLFLTKYATGLLFVALQVTIFTVLSFVLMRWRSGLWEPGLFLAIPIVVCFFSYLFAVQVLFGMLTRSAIASLLLTMLVWFFVFAVHFAEVRLAAFKVVKERQREQWQQRAAELDAQIKAMDAKRTAPDQPDDPWLAANRASRDNMRQWANEAGPTIDKLRFFHRLLYAAKVIGPKTSETTDLLDRNLLSRDEMTSILAAHEGGESNGHRRRRRVSEGRDADPTDVAEALVDVQHGRSVGWVVGTSLAFEAVVLSLGAWIFCRRDY
jgi:hypothetical protein